MVTRPTPQSDVNVTPVSWREHAVSALDDSDISQATETTRTVTVLLDVAAVVRGLACVLLALAILIVAWRGGTNYPTTSAIQAISSAFVSAEKPSKDQPKDLRELSSNALNP